MNIVMLTTDDAKALYRQLIKTSGGALDPETFAAVSRLVDSITAAVAVPISKPH